MNQFPTLLDVYAASIPLTPAESDIVVHAARSKSPEEAFTVEAEIRFGKAKAMLAERAKHDSYGI